jgi:NADH-quinone oxidoreductase subunit H
VLLFFPGGLFLLASGLFYEWVDRKLLARFQNRVGPRWFQPLADMVKLLLEGRGRPGGRQPSAVLRLPVVALAGALTAALYVPLAGWPRPSASTAT